MMEKRIDYKIECLAFMKLLEAGHRITQKEFCLKRSQETSITFSFQAFKQALSRLRSKGDSGRNGRVPPPPSVGGETMAQRAVPDWTAIKESYMGWKFKTLVEVAQYVGQNYNSKSFAKKVAGWHKERNKIEITAKAKTLDVLVKDRAVQMVRDLFADILAANYKLMEMLVDTASRCKDELGEARFKSPWHVQMTAQASMDLSKAMCQILPEIRGIENLQSIHQIFDNLTENKIDVVQASLDLVRLGVALPRPIEILLGRHEPDDTPPDNGEFITDAQIMAKRAEILARIDAQRTDFVAERKQLVEQLKAETKDSFAVTDRAKK